MSAEPAAQFRAQLEEYTIKPDCEDGREYICTRRLTEWMERKEPGRTITNTECLLRASYQSLQRHVGLPISYEKMVRDESDRCVIAFCILLEIGLGHLLHEVQSRDIVDHRLPMSLYELKGKFQMIDPQNGVNYAQQFDKAQWKYVPLVFRLEMDKTLHEQQVLPICRKKGIGRGGQAQVYAIVVQADYVDKELRKRLSNDQHTRFTDPDFGDCFQFALKTFGKGQTNYFHEEKRAFAALRSNKGMIQYLGSFGSPDPTPKNHILLEYGRFDLRKYFQCRLPPVTSLEIENFWKSLIEIVDALEGIHTFEARGRRYHGWHNDIKPENIIVVDGSYKLADPGFAKFKKGLEENPDVLPTITPGGGTITYAAPEQYARSRNPQIEVTQSVDIWSVGCVFSVAATWIVLGQAGIFQFHEVRRRAIADIVRKQHNDQTRGRIDLGDFFHDGQDLLPVVRDWHKYLRSALRNTDHLTGAILDYVEKHLLVANRQISARSLHKDLQTLLEKNKCESIPAQLQTLMETLLDMDEEAISVPQEASTQSASASDAAASANRTRADHLAVPGQMLKTASRSATLSKLWGSRPPLRNTTASPPPAADNSYFAHPARLSQESHLVKGETDLRYSNFSPENHHLKRRSTYQSVRVSEGRAPEPQNVIQAREQLRDLRFYQKGVDPVLKRYFDTREIKFLVDNASSMRSHWDEATYVIETLVMKAKHFDKNGLDLYFTNPSQSLPVLKDEKDEAKFRKEMRVRTPKQDEWAGTDMSLSIEAVFREYFNNIERRRRSKREPKEDLTLIILTDGVWDAMDDPNAIYSYIENLLRQLEQRNIIGYEKRPVSIEFVQFGDDDDATERLRHLDDDMEYRGFKDIIDHEMFSVSGDVRKMLLGSFLGFMDRSTKLSPTSPELQISPTFAGPSNRHSIIVPHNPPLERIVELPTPTQDRTPTNSTGSSAYQTPPENPRNSLYRR